MKILLTVLTYFSLVLSDNEPIQSDHFEETSSSVCDIIENTNHVAPPFVFRVPVGANFLFYPSVFFDFDFYQKFGNSSWDITESGEGLLFNDVKFFPDGYHGSLLGLSTRPEVKTMFLKITEGEESKRECQSSFYIQSFFACENEDKDFFDTQFNLSSLIMLLAGGGSAALVYYIKFEKVFPKKLDKESKEHLKISLV